VPEGFRYSSDSNPARLTREELSDMLKTLEQPS
jgi:hypothetical protein